jgi:hypothetical protein
VEYSKHEREKFKDNEDFELHIRKVMVPLRKFKIIMYQNTYSGSRDQEDHGLKPAWTNSS